MWILKGLRSNICNVYPLKNENDVSYLCISPNSDQILNSNGH